MLERTASPPWDSVITYRDGKRSIAATAEGSISAVRLQAPASRGGSRLAGAALAADPLVELDAVPLLGGLAAFPATKASDLAEEVVSVALLCGLPALSARLSPAHFPGFLHPTTSCSEGGCPAWFPPKPLESGFPCNQSSRRFVTTVASGGLK